MEHGTLARANALDSLPMHQGRPEDRALETDPWRPVGRIEELPTDGGGVSVEVEGVALALFRHAGGVRAIDDACPHEGASLGMGVAKGGDVTCPWHGFHFALESGCNTDGLDLCVRAHPARVRPDGTVEVRLGAV